MGSMNNVKYQHFKTESGYLKQDKKSTIRKLSPILEGVNSWKVRFDFNNKKKFQQKCDSPLILAVKQNNINLLRAALGISKSHEVNSLEINSKQQLLLEEVNDNGETALFYATIANKDNSLKTLLLFGANTYHKNNNQQTAADIAYQRQAWSCLLLLIQNGSPFPQNFDINRVPESEQILINYVDRNNAISNLISQGDVKIISELINNQIIPKTFKSIKNQGAVTIAFINQRFENFVFLKCNGFRELWHEPPIDTSVLSYLEKTLLKNVIASFACRTRSFSC